MKVSAVGEAHDTTFVSKLHAVRTSGHTSALCLIGPAGRWDSTEGIDYKELGMIPMPNQTFLYLMCN